MRSYYSAAGTATTPQSILAHRELRAAEQRRILSLGGQVLVCLTMNIPGISKAFPLASAGFHEGLLRVSRLFSDIPILYQAHSESINGYEGYFLLDAEPLEIKRMCIHLEETHPLGRLWDIDVLTSDGNSISRTDIGALMRPCLLCGKGAKLCARSRAHDIQSIKEKVISILDSYFCKEASDAVRACAEHALWVEVCTTPKPGLVDLRNNGSHNDMDLSTFMDSIHALSPWFSSFYSLGWSCGDEKDLFGKLRIAGLEAERAMFSATNGVNTHKGSIFSFAILCGALGMLQASRQAPLSLSTLQAACQQIAVNCLTDFGAYPANTSGLRCYQENRVSGARGEAAQGFPSVFECALPTLRSWLKSGANLNQAALAALLRLISQVEDTNMIHRGGRTAAAQRKKEAAAVYACSTVESIAAMMQRLDESYIIHTLSPGGSADLLALTLLLHFLINEGILVE